MVGDRLIKDRIEMYDAYMNGGRHWILDEERALQLPLIFQARFNMKSKKESSMLEKTGPEWKDLTGQGTSLSRRDHGNKDGYI